MKAEIGEENWENAEIAMMKVHSALQNAYLKMDRDGDGKVSLSEIQFFIEETGRFLTEQYEYWRARITKKATDYTSYVQNSAVFVIILNKWESLDTDKNGIVTWEEFQVGVKTEIGEENYEKMVELVKNMYILIQNLYLSLDTDGDGRVTSAEVEACKCFCC